MRIALVCPYSLDRPGGVATHVLGLAAWLRSRGHSAVVVAPGTGTSTDEVCLVGGSVNLPFNGSVAQLALGPGQARRAVAAIEGAEVVHVHEPLTPGIAYVTARAARGRLVVTHHASFGPGLLALGLRLRATLVPERASIAVSPAAAATARAATGRVPTVIPNAVELPAAPSGTREPGLVVFLGRLDEPRKGYPTFAAVAGQVPEARFVAIGPGAGGASAVEELGPLSDAERDAILSRAEVLVAPNRFGESFGMVLIEALARGCAVVASDLPAFREVIADSSAATFFPVGDVAAAAALVRARLAAPADPLTAWEAVRRFGWDVVGPQVEAVYESVAQPS